MASPKSDQLGYRERVPPSSPTASALTVGSTFGTTGRRNINDRSHAAFVVTKSAPHGLRFDIPTRCSLKTEFSETSIRGFNARLSFKVASHTQARTRNSRCQAPNRKSPLQSRRIVWRRSYSESTNIDLEAKKPAHSRISPLNH